MKKHTLIVIVTVFMVTVVFAATTHTCGRVREVDELTTKADAIVVVEILSTDYTATASDGPMYAEAKVLKVLKGNISRRRKLHFGETGWWGPTYKKGERRLVFLSSAASKDKYYKAKWHTTYSGSVDFFLAKDSLKNISQASLSSFLTAIEDVSTTPPKIQFVMDQNCATKRKLAIKVINDGSQAFWLNPSRIAFSFEANRCRYARKINWADYEKNTWIKIEPNSSITGFIYVKAEEVKEEDEIKVMLSHLSVCFPYRCWVGFKSAYVGIEG